MSTHAPAERLKVALADRYRFERELGQGGMATVYLAEDLKHDRKVAIKVLKPELAAVLGAERFVVEIKTTASLQHPHILPLFDSGTADGFLFYVMPYIQGETIREKLNRETQFGVDDAVRIAREVASALDYAHRHGVIHRDIKPENILLHDGSPMVMDFGIALAVSAAAGGRMTETGLSLGTPHYMSPEQATADKEITGRSDVYSLASVLYEMLAGEPPHTAGSAQAVIMKIIADTPRPVLELRRNVPPNVSAALSRALEKLPADRFESARAFADALANPAFTTAVGTTVAARSPVRRYARLRATLVAAGLVFLASAGVIVGRQSVRSVEPPVAQFVIELPDSITNLNWCCGSSQVLSRDGSTLVFVGIRAGMGRLYRRSMRGLTAEPIDGTEGASSPALSPDGRWVSFETVGQLKKVLVTGGLAVPIANVGTVSGATWVSNDTILYSSNSNSTLWLIGASGGKPAPVPGLDSSGTYRHPAILPGGRHALVQWRSKATIGEPRIVSVDLRTGDVDTVAVGVVARYALGSIVIGASDGGLLVQSFDLRTRRTVGQPTPLQLRANLSGGLLPEFSVSGNGWLVYEVARSTPGNDVLRILGGLRDSALVLDESGPMMSEFEDIAISPDGGRILVRMGAQQGEIWILNLKEGTRSRLTVGGGSTPVWSPDGKRMAYYSRGDSSSKPGIYTRSIDQNSRPQLVLAGPNLVPNSFTPDGASIAFSLGALNLGSLNPYGSQVVASDIGIVAIGDTTVRWILRTEFNERQPQISKDGRRLAYTSDRSGRFEVYVQGMSGESVPVPVSTNGGTSPRWARDGRLYYIDLIGQVIAVSIPAFPGAVVTRRDTVSRRASSADLNYANVNWDLFPDKRMMIIDRHGVQKLRIALVQNWPALVRQSDAKQ